jgi:excinuclease UvrABC helicase subunit UvrB
MLTQDEIEQLQEYGELEGSEWGETVVALLHVYNYRHYMSDQLGAALDAELIDSLEYVKTHFRIVEHQETRTITVRDLESL